MPVCAKFFWSLEIEDIYWGKSGCRWPWGLVINRADGARTQFVSVLPTFWDIWEGKPKGNFLRMKVLFGTPVHPQWAAPGQPAAPLAGTPGLMPAAGLSVRDSVTLRFGFKPKEKDAELAGPEKAPAEKKGRSAKTGKPVRKRSKKAEKNKKAEVKPQEVPDKQPSAPEAVSPAQDPAQNPAVVAALAEFKKTSLRVVRDRALAFAMDKGWLEAWKCQDSGALDEWYRKIDSGLEESLNILYQEVVEGYEKRSQALLKGKSEDALTPGQTAELNKLAFIFEQQKRMLESLAEIRGKIFNTMHQLVQRDLKGAQSQPAEAPPDAALEKTAGQEGKPAAPLTPERIAAIEQELRQDEGFRKSFAAFQDAYQERFKETALKLITDKEWVSHHLGLKFLSEEQMNAKVDHINQTMLTLKQGVADELGAAAQQEIAELLKDMPQGNVKLADLPTDKQEKVIRIQTALKIKMEWLKAFEGPKFFKRLEQETLRKAEQDMPGTVSNRLAGLKSDNPAIIRMLERCRSDEPETRASGFEQLIALLADPERPEDAKLLTEIISAAALVPVAGVKTHAAEAMLTLPDDEDKTRLMKEWLASGEMNNKLAVLKLFTLTQGFNNTSITQLAHQLRVNDPELHRMIDDLHKVDHKVVQQMLGVIDEWDAARADWERRAKAFSRPSSRLITPPVHEKSCPSRELARA